VALDFVKTAVVERFKLSGKFCPDVCNYDKIHEFEKQSVIAL
jgi:hypothetical protein